MAKLGNPKHGTFGQRQTPNAKPQTPNAKPVPIAIKRGLKRKDDVLKDQCSNKCIIFAFLRTLKRQSSTLNGTKNI
jgi:hypothetical protein